MLGALIIDKPVSFTSHDVVARIRRATGIRRVGHAGTLDPFATGVLVVCIGRATRLVQFLVGLDKQYDATIRLGYATDTQDRTGKQITPLRSSKEVSLDDLRKVLDRFTGPQLQMPPMYSAKKVRGEKLYQAARSGREVEREAVSITVHSIGLLEEDGLVLRSKEDGTLDFRVRVRCSSGTYVRTLAHDIGESLGVGAHLSELRRTDVGHFNIAGALSLDEVEAMSREELFGELISPAAMLSHLPALVVDDDGVKRVKNGRVLELSENEAAGMVDAGSVRLCDRDGELVGVGEVNAQASRAIPRVVLAS